MDMRFLTKFTMSLFSVFTVFFVAGFYGYQEIKANLINEQIEINLAETEALETKISRWLEKRKTEISTLANTPTIRSMNWLESGPFVKQKHAVMPWFYIFAHINPDGTYFNSKVDFAEGKNLSDRAHFKASINGNVYASDPVVSRTLGTDIVAITSPIYRDDTADSDIIGVFGGMIDTKTIVEELANFENEKGSYAFALNSGGIAISHPDEERMGNINTKAISLVDDSDPGLAKVAARMMEGNTGWERTVIDGQDSFVTYTPVKQADWYIATVIDSAQVQQRLKALNLVALVFVIAVLSSFFLVFRLQNAEASRLKQEKSIVEEKNNAKSVFIASMSHELRTPLNAIIGYADILLAENELKGSDSNRVSAISKSGKHLLNLINRILDISKIEAGKLDLDLQEVNLKDFLQDTSKSLKIASNAYPIQFSSSIEVEDLVAFIDPDKLLQIINNIVTNAFKYGRDGSVTFAAKIENLDKQQLLKISVSDQGIGMTRQQLKSAFTAFEQVDSKSTGLGLGLTIVQQLINLMSGKLDIETEAGSGTSVTLSIPILTNHKHDTTFQEQTSNYMAVDAENLRVLIIDDNDENLDLYRDLLQSINFSVSVARDGEEGLTAFESSKFDLVITDLVMPKANGFEVIEAIRKGPQNSDIPIIVASASALAEDRSRSLDLGANRFFSKPIEIEQLVKSISVLLELKVRKGTLTQGYEDNLTSELRDLVDISQIQDTEFIDALIDMAELGRLVEINKTLDAKNDEISEFIKKHISEAMDQLDAEQVIDKLRDLNNTG